ncbi:MAG: SpoIIE family protein phosphatase [Bacteroidota bacterium]
MSMILIWTTIALFVLPTIALTQLSIEREQGEGVRLTASRWIENPSILTWDVPWRYHQGDNPEWAMPEHEDSSWELATTWLREGEHSRSGWSGVGWFRLHLVVDSTFPRPTLGLTGSHSGKIRIYWDGVLQSEQLGYSIPDAIPAGGPGDHVLAVRYELQEIEKLHEREYGAGFFIRLGEFHETITLLIRQRTEQMFFTALVLAFGILHLMLFLFSPSSRGNLYYALFLFTMAGVIYADIQHVYFVSDGLGAERYLLMHRALVPFSTIFFLRFLYTIFYDRCPRQFWFLTALMIGTGIVVFLNPQTHYEYYVVVSTVLTVEMVRVLIVAIVKRKSGAWIIASGFLMVGIFGTYDSLLDLDLLAPIGQTTNAYYFGLIGLLVAMSIYLARDFARTSRRLVEQVKQTDREEMARRLVEADNARKTRELEEARELQLSMLPACRNDIPGIDVCLHMETATEVGGDYYDYLQPEDGSLILAVGDATGHGMKAGTMVSIVKGLFITQAPHDDFQSFLGRSSEAIKQMKLGNLYMGLTLARIKDGILTVASAGMPPVYVYRDVTGSVDEILIKSMPLGGPGTLLYETRETPLAAGDILLLMSDGLPEMFSPEREILDYPRVKEMFREAADLPAADIVHHLGQRGKEWANGRPQGDDVTLVVVRVTG